MGVLAVTLPSLSTHGRAGGTRDGAAPGIPALPPLPGWVLCTELGLELLSVRPLGMVALAMLMSRLHPGAGYLQAAGSKALRGGRADAGAGEAEMQNPGERILPKPHSAALSKHKAFPGRRARGRDALCFRSGGRRPGEIVVEDAAELTRHAEALPFPLAEAT